MHIFTWEYILLIMIYSVNTCDWSGKEKSHLCAWELLIFLCAQCTENNAHHWGCDTAEFTLSRPG